MYHWPSATELQRRPTGSFRRTFAGIERKTASAMLAVTVYTFYAVRTKGLKSTTTKTRIHKHSTGCNHLASSYSSPRRLAAGPLQPSLSMNLNTRHPVWAILSVLSARPFVVRRIRFACPSMLSVPTCLLHCLCL